MAKYKFVLTKTTEKKYRKLIKRNPSLRKKVVQTIKLLKNDPFSPALKTHKVNHSQHGYLYSSNITGDLRLIWDFKKGSKKLVIHILALDIGGYNEVYR